MNRPKVVGIVQARMSSERLPGKVLADLGGRPVLEWVTKRLAHASTVDEVLVATSVDPSDEEIVEWCTEAGVRCFRGSLDDVLSRFAEAADHAEAGIVVRITADCPLIDPKLVDSVVRHLLDGDLDYCGLGGEFPDGLDCEVMTAEALGRAHTEASLASEREHVTPYLQRPDRGFRVGSVEPFVGREHHRWTLDRLEDLSFLRAVANRFGGGPLKPKTGELFALLDAEPELQAVNAGIVRNEGYQRSLAKDSEQDGPHAIQP